MLVNQDICGQNSRSRSANMVRFLLLLVWLLSLIEIGFLQDPCVSNVPLPRAAYRGGECMFNENKPVCDADLPEGWYRVQIGIQNLAIQTTPAKFLSCGTKFSYWMNGTHPNSTDSEVNRTICKTDLLSECSKHKTIRVKSCGNFYVYRLMRTDSCPEGYCFGQNDTCPPFDPCDIYEHTDAEVKKSRDFYCDQTDQCSHVDFNKWYRINGSASVKSVLNQSYSKCSSGKHTWIEGTPGTTVHGISKTTLCVADKNSNCSETHHVYSKKCHGFSVYKFPAVLNTTCEKLCMGSTGKGREIYTCLQKPPSGSATYGPRFSASILCILGFAQIILFS